MQLDKLVLDLRPRTNMQALDLGFALLRIAPLQVYWSWLALWLPLMALLTLLACIWPSHSSWLLFVAWWLRPLLERAPLYILSRAVFGENVGWREAVRAWPRQLGGGSIRMLLLRPFMAGRCLRQAIWQLEGARGRIANERYRLISRQNAGSSATMFGIACAHFEAVLQLGVLALIGIFVHQSDVVNPFAVFAVMARDHNSILAILLSYGAFTLGAAIIAPIYTACGFTLYLNRRATLEAWDIEIVLRQIHPPHKRKHGAALAAALLPLLLALTLGAATLLPAPTTQAAPTVDKKVLPATDGNCEAPAFWHDPRDTREADQDANQTALRAEVQSLYQQEDLRSFRCEEHWQLKERSDTPPKKKDEESGSWPGFGLLDLGAGLFKILLIIAALCLAIWFLYHFRNSFAGLLPQRRVAKQAQEVGGLDIRPESLPDDILKTVRQLWQKDEQRAALGLLYRATLSRLVSQNDLHLSWGATEGDCLREARQAHLSQRLGALRWNMTREITDIWLLAAYGQRWPDTDKVMAVCQQWQQAFEVSEETDTKASKSAPALRAGGAA